MKARKRVGHDFVKVGSVDWKLTYCVSCSEEIMGYDHDLCQTCLAKYIEHIGSERREQK